MKFLKSAAALAVLAAVAATPAQAAVSGSATGSFSYYLFDIDPTDAVTPSISFGGDYGGTYANYGNAYVEVSSNGDWSDSYAQSNALIQNVSISQGYSNAAGTITPTSVSAGGTSLGSNNNYNGGGFYSSSSLFQNFNLTKNTVVVFQFNYQLAASSNIYPEAENADYYGEYYENVYSTIGMSLIMDHDFDGEYGNGEGSYQSQFINASLNAFNGQSLDKSGKLFISYTSDQAASGSLQFDARTDGYTNVSAVPEPETYAMLLAGLGLIGTVARRRRGKQA